LIPKDIIDKIFETARVEEVIGDFIHLKKSGSNYKGLSPFSKERTPSFMVSPAKNIWKDFSSGKGGNAVTFIMEHEHFTYPEALRFLAKKYNIEIPEEKERSAEDVAEANERESLMLVNAFAQEFFTEQLHQTDEGKNIGLSYLKERGFEPRIIEAFKLGYCPEAGSAFSEAALAKGYQQKYLEATGLTRMQGDKAVDFFRGRIIFPIQSISGRILGFGARTLRTDKKIAKYFNSPESVVYHKSNVLYGISQAKAEIILKNNCFLVEGYTDVIALHQAGIKNVVASSGTALTEDQVRLIKRYTPNVTILYDGDSAGIKASFRGIDLILAQDMNVRVALFPEGDDPDSFAKKHSDTEIVEFLENNSRDFVEFKAEVMMADAGRDPMKRAAVIKDIVASIALIPDEIKRSVYIKTCSNRLEIDEQTLNNQLEKLLRQSFRKRNDISEEEVGEPNLKAQRQQEEQPATLQSQEKEMMRMLLNYGMQEVEIEFEDEESQKQKVTMLLSDVIIGEMQSDDLSFENFLYQRIFVEYIKLREDDIMPDANHFIRHEDKHIASLTVDLMSSPYTLSHQWAERHHIYTITEEDRLPRAVMDAVYTYKLRRVLQLIRKDEELLKNASPDFDYTTILERKRKYDQVKIKLAQFSGSTIL
jgi:DNA primase